MAPDNRKFPRATFKRGVKYRTTSAVVFSGHMAQDISAGGVRLNSNEFFPLGHRMAVQVQLDSQSRLFDLEAKVVWVKQLPHAETYQLGLEFVGGPAFEKWKIAEYVFKTKGSS